MRRAAMLAAMAMTMAAGVAACSRLANRFAEPEVTFKGLNVRGLGITGGSLDVLLQVKNVNSFALDATRLTYKLMADSLEVGSGATDQRMRIDGGDSTIVSLPVDFKWSGLGAAGRQLLNSGTLNYRVLGDISVGSPLGTFTIPYDQRGRYSPFGGGTR
jgi:LEA14-like dessication related protein